MVSLYQFLSHGVLQYKKMFDQCNRYRDELKVKTPTVKTLVQNLSGGNQQKVILAKWIMRDCDVLLIDEPTQSDFRTRQEHHHRVFRTGRAHADLRQNPRHVRGQGGKNLQQSKSELR